MTRCKEGARWSFRSRRRPAAGSLASATVAQSDFEEVDEGRGDSERREDVGQPRPGPKEFVQAPPASESDPDRDRKHPSDRRSFEQLLPLAQLLVRIVVIVRHG